MAVDEALLESYERSAPGTGPTLRLYGWQPGAVSLGRSQRGKGIYDPDALRRLGLDLVRRPSGGAAVLHENERTYAVVGTLGSPPFSSGVIATYRAIADALTRALQHLGVPAVASEPRRKARRDASVACFERVGEWEIVAAGRKVVGSAQARRRRAVLQHGSIPMRLDPERLEAVLGRAVDGSRFIDLEGVIGRAVDGNEVDAAVVGGFETAFGAHLRRGALDESEALRAAELRCWKYDSIAWTVGGRIGAREARWGPALTV
jgi:lipoate-protein ligase A